MKTVPVTCVRCDGEAALIEWMIDNGDFCRGTVPCSALRDGKLSQEDFDAGRHTKVSQEDLDAAIPYGLCWESVIELTVTSDTIGKELRRRGIWTAEDLAARFNAACQAIRGLHDREMVALLHAAQEVE